MLRQLLINSHILKHEVTRNSLLIIYIFSDIIHFIIHSVTKNCILIGIVNYIEASLTKCFEILSKFSTNLNFGGCACTPCTPNSYTTVHKYKLTYDENVFVIMF